MEPTVYMMLGLTGSGKSTFSVKLAKELGIERFAFDLKYKNLGGDLSDHKWNEAVSDKTVVIMKSWMKDRLKRNESVILDYCPWRKDERDAYRALIKSLGATCRIYYFEVEQKKLLKRLTRRNDIDKTSQYVTREMLGDFEQKFEVPNGEEVDIIKA